MDASAASFHESKNLHKNCNGAASGAVPSDEYPTVNNGKSSMSMRCASNASRNCLALIVQAIKPSENFDQHFATFFSFVY